VELSGLIDLLRSAGSYRALLSALRAQKVDEAMPALGVLRAARPFVLAALARDWRGPVIYITARVDRAYSVVEQLPVWLGDTRPILRFNEPTPLFYERAPWGETALRGRIQALASLLPPSDIETERWPQPVIVTSARALMQRTLPVNTFRGGLQTLHPGQRWQLDKLLAQWVQLGYESASMVTERGRFSRRGGIVDVFPPALDRPVRIEFFDDEIESLREFDPATQRTTARLEQAVITPAREALPVMAPALASHLADWFASLPPAEADMTMPTADAAALMAGTVFPLLEFYLPYLVPQPISLIDYAADDALFIIEDKTELRDTIDAIAQASEKLREERIAEGQLPPDFPRPYLNWAELEAALSGRIQAVIGGLDAAEGAQRDSLRGILAPEQRFGGQLKPFLSELRALRGQRHRVVVVTAQAARLQELWQEQEAAPVIKTTRLDEAPPPRSVIFVEGTLSEGWRLALEDGQTHLFTDAEIFGWSRPEPRRRRSLQRPRTPENAYADLREGDYIVHIDYGVGRFAGLRRRTLEGVEREYLMIEYSGTDTLFVPIHQADRLTRYIGPDDRPPTLSKLGQPDWIRIRSKAKQAVEEEARELLALYAAREASSRPPLGVDTPWQHELEASFPYIETEDQLKAVRAVKEDLERSHPMDRLICGDVGYGKTEVALRAAFKVAVEGRQVAVLVPTTILAQQHYDTFKQRLTAFPIRVEMLSRFRTREAQNTILRQLAEGKIELIIGTHRLLQPDVRFANLGLVIIDEEQRFGVKHKEHFKRLRTAVDVLTLTATPIPRTLYMGLAGVRDISMIQTPPEERLPVITHVGVFDERLVRQAVLREMDRGGQVYFVHNRVQTIHTIAERLAAIVPEARIVVGHGQMDGRTLETVMRQFSTGDFDLLLSTSIVESGLDIPNANTLIIDRADWFGLAQLYQLRGRVGRSAQQAYAYFFHPPAQQLTDEARARLETLKEYTDLGSGFQIAMRDLELRGAGDILSTRQTGHVAAIGLHLYTQMLAQAVRQLRGGDAHQVDLPPAPPISQATILIDLPLPAYLPTDWIPEMALRLQLYRRIGGLTSLEEVDAMRAELRDRFGPLPTAVEGMLYQIAVKLLAQRAGATAVLARTTRIDIRLPYLPDIDRERLGRRLGEAVHVSRTAVEVPIDDDWRARLQGVLSALAETASFTLGH